MRSSRLYAAIFATPVACLPTFELRECYSHGDCGGGLCSAAGRCIGEDDDAGTSDAGPSDAGPSDGGTGTSTCTLTDWRRVIPSDGNGAQVAIAWGNGALGIAHAIYEQQRLGIHFVRTSSEGVALGPSIPVHTATIAAVETFVPLMVFAQDAFHIVYLERRGLPVFDRLHYAKIAADGASVLRSAAIGPREIHSYPSSLIFDGRGLVLAWTDVNSADTYLTRLSLSGEVESTGHVVVAIGEAPSVAFNDRDGELGYTFNAFTGEFMSQNLFFARVEGGGVDVLDEIAVTSTSGDAAFSSLAFDGEAYGLAFETTSSGTHDVYFQRLMRSGAVLAPPVRIARGATDISAPRVLYNAERGEYPLVWQRREEPGLLSEVYFALLARDGTPIGPPLRINRPDGRASRPDIAWSGSEYLVVHEVVENQRQGAYLGSVSCR